MFNKESERYLSDDHLKNGDQVFESAFSNQGPEFESAFQEEKAEKRHFFLTFVLPLIVWLYSLYKIIFYIVQLWHTHGHHSH